MINGTSNKQRHVLITGGSSGIGLATAQLAVARGAKVSLVARRADVLEAAAAEAGPGSRVSPEQDDGRAAPPGPGSVGVVVGVEMRQRGDRLAEDRLGAGAHESERRRYTLDVALDFLACGLDPQKALLFRQSDVPEVTELAWMLTTLTPMGLLERCTSYKDKIARGLSPFHGLFAYPVLMAADILIYDSNIVPVGRDQKQHVVRGSQHFF